ADEVGDKPGAAVIGRAVIADSIKGRMDKRRGRGAECDGAARAGVAAEICNRDSAAAARCDRRLKGTDRASGSGQDCRSEDGSEAGRKADRVAMLHVCK